MSSDFGVKSRQFEVLRYDASTDCAPRFQTYTATPARRASVLEALLQIQAEQDPSLALRYCCRGAVCGSCAMSINGNLALACRVQVADLPGDRVILEPLPHLAVLKDLVVDMEPFWRKYEQIRPWLHARPEEPADGRMSGAQREKIDQYVNCTLCGLCYAACPATSADEDFSGPAALAKLYRFVSDSREDPAARTLEAENHREGIWGCRSVGRCIDVCPKDVRPRDGIAGLRRKMVADKFKGLLLPRCEALLRNAPSGSRAFRPAKQSFAEAGSHAERGNQDEAERGNQDGTERGNQGESHMARRRYLCRMIAGGAAAMASGAVVPLVSYLGNLREEPPPPFLKLPRAQWDLQPGTSKLFRYGPIPAILIRTPQPGAALRVFVATCTHFDCIVGYRRQENRITCACHGGVYNLDGTVRSGPPPRPLRPFYFRVHEGDLWMALEEENLEKALRQAGA